MFIRNAQTTHKNILLCGFQAKKKLIDVMPLFIDCKTFSLQEQEDSTYKSK